MTKKKLWLAIFFVWLFVDLGCMAIAKRGSGLFSFGARGLVIDFVLGIIVLGMYLRAGETP